MLWSPGMGSRQDQTKYLSALFTTHLSYPNPCLSEVLIVINSLSTLIPKERFTWLPLCGRFYSRCFGCKIEACGFRLALDYLKREKNTAWFWTLSYLLKTQSTLRVGMHTVLISFESYGRQFIISQKRAHSAMAIKFPLDSLLWAPR